MLLVPSSLYVWSKLEDRNKNHSILSAFELMNTWWNQILRQCEMANITRAEAINCKNKIVEAMEKKGVFVLPSLLFIDFQRIIDFFASNGLLNHNPIQKPFHFHIKVFSTIS